MVKMGSLMEMRRPQTLLVFVFIVSSQILCTLTKPASFLDAPNQFTLRNVETYIPDTLVPPNTLQDVPNSIGTDDPGQHESLSDSTRIHSSFTNSSTSSYSATQDDGLTNDVESSEKKTNDDGTRTEGDPFQAFSPPSPARESRHFDIGVPQTTSSRTRQLPFDDVSTHLVDSDNRDSLTREEISVPGAGEAYNREIGQRGLYRKKKSLPSSLENNDHVPNTESALFDLNGPPDNKYHQQILFQNKQRSLQNGNRQLLDNGADIAAELYRLLESNILEEDDLQPLLWSMSKDGYSNIYPESRNPQHPPQISNDLLDSSSYEIRNRVGYKHVVSPPQGPKHFMGHSPKPELETFPRRPTRAYYFSPRRLYTSPIGGQANLRQDVSHMWRTERSRSRSSGEALRARLGQMCNHRRVTREMLLEFFTTGKMCGSSIVRIRFGLG